MRRQVSLACVVDAEHPLESCLGDWVLVHVGFAMSRIDEAQAAETLEALTRLGEVFDLYQRAMASTRRILDLLDTKPMVTGGERTLERPRGEVRFEEVGFRYANGVQVLDGLTLDLPAGETTAIVGAT